MRSPVDCPDITIQNGGTTSNAVLVDKIHADADDILIMASVIDAARTYVIQVNDQRDAGGTWYTLFDGTTNIVPPGTVGLASVYPFLNHTFRILANGAVTGAVTWKMKKTYSVGTGLNNS